MDMFDFFFPEQAEASHLRRISSSLSRTSVSTHAAADAARRAADEVTDLRDDVKFLTLVVTAILKRLAETETMSLDDVKDLFDEIDGLDGIGDGGLEPGALRGLLGVLKQEVGEQPQSETEQINIVTTPRTPRRYRR